MTIPGASITSAPLSVSAMATAQTPTSGISSLTNSSPTSGLNQLDNTQTFLQLLVAQLKNQDPTNPSDPTQFMTEIAQMTAVQSQTSLAAEEQTVAADSMLGRTVNALNGAGAPVTGVVDGVLLSSSGAPELQIGSGSSAQDVSVTAVTKVS
ncbi:hypothetical protein K6U06_11740 [Acidiferrimicrobium sp. IK]|uniref:flagellar hook capping FlgD N-terminal domain-containing protein n=1 Tax=Acidiferrimicrobium sp. IK TaxID=2871700 RepID=UPI0021CB2A0F|nr:flagellar hook capping FlgD N-terminal domain-containing protein [Acidiferrimicrobium sp. IK]MCU4185035.1 hypothetical protein [Acidiferrimicrobium sp. IK]